MRSSKDIWFEAWEDYYAKSDSIRERYHREMQDIKNYDLIEQEHNEYMNKVWLAGYGDDQDEYESYWNRSFEYYKNQPDEPFDLFQGR
jgi:hypothetical protein